jgi:hypothetical protein
VAKTDRNFKFLDREAHILYQLYIMVMYIKFYGFYKILNFNSKFNGVGLRFYRKMSVCGKTWPKFHISWLWGVYSESVIHNGLVYKFLGFKKIQISAQNIKVLAFDFTENGILQQKLIETMYFLPWLTYSGSIIHNDHVYMFLWVKKIKFGLKIKRC